MRLGFDRLWLVIALLLPALISLLAPLPAVDLAYQVRAGDEILRTGAIPAADAWTFTVAGAPWTDQQWLAQVVLAGLFRVGGWELLAVLRAGLVTAAVGLLVATAIARGTTTQWSSVLGLLAFGLAAPALALRPQLFGVVIFAALLWLVATRAAHPRRLWAAPVLVLLWANVHGSFVLGPVVLGYAWLDDAVRGRPARSTFVMFVVGLLATVVTPFGPGVWSYAAGIGANPAITGQVSEWQRTTPFTVLGAMFYLSAVAGLVVLVRGRAALRWPDWLWFAGMLAIGAWTVRGLAWWPFALVFVVAAALPAAWAPAGFPAPARKPARGPALIALVLLGIVVIALPWWRPSDPLTGRAGLLTYAPSGLAQALRGPDSVGARVFTPQTWASWFEWAAPDSRYFLDSRFELFPAEVWADYEAIVAGGEGAASALARWGVQVIVLPAKAVPPPGWVDTYRDADGAVLVPGPSQIQGSVMVPSGDPDRPSSSAIVARQWRSDR